MSEPITRRPVQGPVFSEAQRKRGEVRGHQILMVLCLLLVGTAFILTPANPERPSLSLAGSSLPPLCMWKQSTGKDCPGCGLTRSWVAAAHFDMKSSLAFHRLGWLAMLYTAVQAMRHGMWLALASRRGAIERFGYFLDRSLFVYAGLLLVNWVLGVAGI